MVSSFLTDWSMVVEVDGQKSSSRALFSGVPQRSVPLHLFFIYICQLSVWTNSSLDRRDLNDLIAWVNEDLESIVRWSTENGLLLSPTKSQAILVSNSPSTLPLPILFLGGVALEWKNVVTVDMLRRFVPKFMLRWECVRSFATIVVQCTSLIYLRRFDHLSVNRNALLALPLFVFFYRLIEFERPGYLFMIWLGLALLVRPIFCFLVCVLTRGIRLEKRLPLGIRSCFCAHGRSLFLFSLPFLSPIFSFSLSYCTYSTCFHHYILYFFLFVLILKLLLVFK
jgi:hypothetical protein